MKDRYYEPKFYHFAERLTCIECGKKYTNQSKNPDGFCRKCKKHNHNTGNEQTEIPASE